MIKSIITVVIGTVVVGISGCSVFMEAQRPTPVNPHQFVVGESRMNVIVKLGPSLSSLKGPSSENCDVYRLYTSGLSGGERAGIGIAEGATDIMTFGLSEALFTPLEGVTANKKHPVVFCYKNNKLVSVRVGPAN